MFLAPIFYIIFCFLVGYFASRRGRSGWGFGLLSLIVSPLIGIIIVLILPQNTAVADERAVATGQMRKCEKCAELVKAEAAVCKHCGHTFEKYTDAELAQAATTQKPASALDLD